MILFLLLVDHCAVSSNPVNVPQIMYGNVIEKEKKNTIWSWSKTSSPIFKCSDKVFHLFLLRY
jgi:acylaminoacyl-peptidase